MINFVMIMVALFKAEHHVFWFLSSSDSVFACIAFEILCNYHIYIYMFLCVYICECFIIL